MTEYGSFGKGYYKTHVNELRALNVWERMYIRFSQLFFFDKELELLFDIPQRGRVLDVGCATGRSLLWYKRVRSDLEYYGIDVGDVKEQMPAFVHFCQGDAQTMSYSDEMFDFVVVRHLFEHVSLDERLNILKECYRVLKNGGVLFVLSPSEESLFVKGGMNFFSDPTHVRPMTEVAYLKMCNILGLPVPYTKKVRLQPVLLSFFIFCIRKWKGMSVQYWYSVLNNARYKMNVMMIIKKRK